MLSKTGSEKYKKGAVTTMEFLNDCEHEIGENQRYRLIESLGEGGMGNVFLAMDTRLGKRVALKLLKESLADDETMRVRFEWELAVCAALKSQHIVQVTDYGLTAQGYPFYVMEYLQGQTLADLLEQQRCLSPQQAVQIITQVCDGLKLAHEGVELCREGKTCGDRIKVIHRDLKPANIFLVSTSLGNLVKVIDFGIAKIRNLQAELTSVTNFFLGTCHYAAPEQLEGAKDLDERADIYNLGLILYEMLVGVDPFGFNPSQSRVSDESWIFAHASKPPIPLRSQPNCQHLPPTLEAAIMRCLQKLPEDRFSSVQHLNQALQVSLSEVGGDVGNAGSVSSVGDAKEPERPLRGTQKLPADFLERPRWREKEQVGTLSRLGKTMLKIMPNNLNLVISPQQPEKMNKWLVTGSMISALAIGVYSAPKLFNLLTTGPSTEIATNHPTQSTQELELALLQAFSNHSDAVRPPTAASAEGQTLVSGGEDGMDKNSRLEQPALLPDVAGSDKSNHCITREEIIRAQAAWGDGIVFIGEVYVNDGDYKAFAADWVDQLYNYHEGKVLFKPTTTSAREFRFTEAETTSYFATGEISEDRGFALQPWSDVRFENAGVIINCDSALAMGDYSFTNVDTGEEVKAEYTFGYHKNKNGDLKINLHHSSFPAQ